MARGIATVTQGPAEAVGLRDRGRLAVGARADVIRVSRIGAAARVHGLWAAAGH